MNILDDFSTALLQARQRKGVVFVHINISLPLSIISMMTCLPVECSVSC